MATKQDTSPEPELGENSFTITLQPRFANYVRARAAAHGHTPEEEAVLIIQAFWAHHDIWRFENAPGSARPGTRGSA